MEVPIMHVAKVVRSGTTVSIELPPGFSIGEGEMEVRQDGEILSLHPITLHASEWAWLDGLPDIPDEFTDIVARIEAEDTALAQTPPSSPLV